MDLLTKVHAVKCTLSQISKCPIMLTLPAMVQYLPILVLPATAVQPAIAV